MRQWRITRFTTPILILTIFNSKPNFKWSTNFKWSSNSKVKPFWFELTFTQNQYEEEKKRIIWPFKEQINEIAFLILSNLIRPKSEFSLKKFFFHWQVRTNRLTKVNGFVFVWNGSSVSDLGFVHKWRHACKRLAYKYLYYSRSEIQLNVITLGLVKSDNSYRRITTIGDLYLLIFCKWDVWNMITKSGS